MFTSGGMLEPDRNLKIFWGLIEGGTAAVLLLAGGLNALQTASIASAFPFMFVICGMIYSMFKSFDREVKGVYKYDDKGVVAPAAEGETTGA
jgi:glycine betaine transporter